MYKNTPVVIVAAMSEGRHAIGRQNGLLWHIPDDMKRFKELTLGNPVIMGRKTFESIVAILGKPLSGRTNIVESRNPAYTYEGVETATSLEDAFSFAHVHNPTEIHIGGGSELYRQALPYVDRIHATFVHDEPESDAFFPDFESEFEIFKKHGLQECGNLTYEWIDFKRSH